MSCDDDCDESWISELGMGVNVGVIERPYVVVDRCD
jgi:hypothetical protein